MAVPLEICTQQRAVIEFLVAEGETPENILKQLQRVYLARIQKFAMGGCFGSLVAEPSAIENFTFFCKNNVILELF